MSEDLFDTFWSHYPKRRQKGDARKAWAKLNPSTELVQRMINALDWQRKQPDWTKDKGQFIPYPATWLRAEQWEDEPTDDLSRAERDRGVADLKAFREEMQRRREVA